jgi:UDP-N-acetylmuramoyl-tripeptide--D-alanyl-D-alanine ligase
MKELGDHEKAAHEKLGELLSASRADMIFLYGREMISAATVLEAKKAPFFYTDAMEELTAAAASSIRRGDLVLLKGSRSCALERLTETVLAGGNADVP